MDETRARTAASRVETKESRKVKMKPVITSEREDNNDKAGKTEKTKQEKQQGPKGDFS